MPYEGPVEDELIAEYKDFLAEYKPTIFEVTNENREALKKIDPNLVWTHHSTCENEMLSPGFMEFSPTNCCWHEQAWYVSEKPWHSDSSSEWIAMSANLPCIECNPEGELDEGVEDCPTCEGNGFNLFYVD